MGECSIEHKEKRVGEKRALRINIPWMYSPRLEARS